MQPSTIVLLASLVLLSHGATLPKDSTSINHRIVGGETVSIKDYPYQAALFFLQNYRCVAVILNQLWVLSAGHCIGAAAAEFFWIRAGSDFRHTGGVTYEAEKIVFHPQFNFNTLDNDVVLLKLTKEIEFTDLISPIAYHGQNQVVPVGEILRVSGWGSTNIANDDLTLLRAVSVPMVDQAQCRQQHIKSPRAVTDNMLCAGWPEGGRDACGGDSGGPLVNLEGVLVGVVSWGVGCARPDSSGVYARVASFSNWLSDTTKLS